MKKTLFVYGSLSIILLVQFALISVMGLSPESDIGVALFIINGLLVLVAAMLDPQGLLCMLLAWIPFRHLLHFEVGIITFNPYTIGIILLAFMVILLSLIGRIKFPVGRLDVLIFLLSIAYLISTMFSETLQLSGFLAFHAIFIPVMSYIAIKGMVQTEAQYRKVMIFFVSGIVIYAIYCILQFDFGRRSVILAVPIISAAAMFVTASVIMLGLGWTRQLTGKLSVGAIMLAFLGTLSRGYLILLVVAPYFWQLIRRGKAKGLMIFLLVGSLIGTVFLAYNAEIFRPAGNYKKTEEQTIARITNINFWKLSIYGRAYVYKEGLEEFTQNPLFGKGMYRPIEHNVRHNFHVEWLEYGGIVVYVLYCLLFISHFAAMARYAREDRYVAVNLLIIFLILANGLTNSFTVGVATYYGFIFIALNEGRRMILRDRVAHP